MAAHHRMFAPQKEIPAPRPGFNMRKPSSSAVRRFTRDQLCHAQLVLLRLSDRCRCPHLRLVNCVCGAQQWFRKIRRRRLPCTMQIQRRLICRRLYRFDLVRDRLACDGLIDAVVDRLLGESGSNKRETT